MGVLVKSPLRTMSAFAALAVAVALATPAKAAPELHLRLTGSQPAKDTVLAAAPTQICLWYSQKPQLRLSSVTLTGPNGPVALGDLTMEARDSAPIVTKIEGPVPPGKYVIAWRTASSDGHPIRGTIPFMVR